MRSLIEHFFVFTVILVLIFGASAAGFAANEIYFLRPAEDALKIAVTVPEGASAASVSRTLMEEKLISSSLLFRFYLKRRGLDIALQPGTYEIRRGTRIKDIAETVSAPHGAEEFVLTVIPGWSIREIGAALEREGILKEDWYGVVGRPPSAETKEVGETEEGYLFPDTYRIFKTSSAEEIAEKLLGNFNRRVGEIDYDDLILASIVEREVKDTEDRRKVADIFLRRLEIGMPLQADSTVNYVTGKKTPALSAEDRNLDSPWNTYKYRGLTPTPIGNPGLDAIRAAQNPLRNDFWYFLTDKDGNVHYGRTLDEHNQNKARYLQ